MKKQTVSLLIFAIAALAAGAFCIGYSSREEIPPAFQAFDVAGLKQSDIASIRFIRLMGRNQTWETDDAQVISDVYQMLSQIELTAGAMSATGGYLSVKLYFHQPFHGKDSVTFPFIDKHLLMGPADSWYTVTNTYSDAQIDAILEQCTLVYDSAQ